MAELRSPRRAVAAMFILNGALFGIWAARIPAFVARFDLDPHALGLLLLCLAGGAILSFPLAGWLTDRRGAADVTRAIGVIYCAALVGLALAPSLPLLAVALALFGAAHGAMDVAMNAWGAEVERHLKRPVMSSFHAMFSLGAGLGAASGFVAVRLGLPVAAHFALGAMLPGVVTLWFASIPWTSERDHGDGPKFALPDRRLVLVGIVAFCTSLGEGAMADWSAVFLATVARATEAQAALGYAAFSVTMVATRLAGDRAVRLVGPVTAARLSGAMALAGVALATVTAGFWSALAGFALMGVGYALIIPLAFSRAAADPVVRPGRAIAGVATLGYGGMLLGPPVIGFLTLLMSLRLSFALLGVLALVGIALAPALRRPSPLVAPRSGNLDP